MKIRSQECSELIRKYHDSNRIEVLYANSDMRVHDVKCSVLGMHRDYEQDFILT